MESPRILVAEDEFIIGADLCDTVSEAGYRVEGPHENITSAMLALQKDRPDAAILDVRLEDGEVFPLAEKLMADNIPVIFHSGQISVAEVHQRFPGALACSKPCPPGEMIEMVRQALHMH